MVSADILCHHFCVVAFFPSGNPTLSHAAYSGTATIPVTEPPFPGNSWKERSSPSRLLLRCRKVCLFLRSVVVRLRPRAKDPDEPFLSYCRTRSLLNSPGSLLLERCPPTKSCSRSLARAREPRASIPCCSWPSQLTWSTIAVPLTSLLPRCPSPPSPATSTCTHFGGSVFFPGTRNPLGMRPAPLSRPLPPRFREPLLVPSSRVSPSHPSEQSSSFCRYAAGHW
mmetsp:Transcript_1343/g.4654  ORF Transcript_1343/g.4654 Transcript_1343/m.4654 type:complete len:225 (-) Transcript_1343:742-1416(-)